MITKELNIRTTTTGFASPAESYVEKRLDLNDLIMKNVYSTFFFRYQGPNIFGVEQDDILVIDKSEIPQEGDLVVLIDKSYHKLREYQNQDNLWGKVTWIISKK
jgi:DNA polymerase V